MRFYTYEDVKNIEKGTNFIVLLMVSDGDYIGLAHQNISYNIKPKHFNIEQYDFIVCARVDDSKGEYYIPIGYSNEDEWVEQEEEYKMKIMKIDNEIKNIIQEYPYFISVGLGNNWNKNISLDKTLLIRALNEFKWEWYLEESYINDYVYSLIIKFDFSENEPKYLEQLYGGMDKENGMYEKLAIYISKEVFKKLKD